MAADARKARSIFLEAVEIHPPEGWDDFLDQACHENLDLRERVALLLRAHAEANSLLDQPGKVLLATVDEPIGQRSGTTIGPYKLLEEIGEGGMGSVWMAEQRQPVQRKVALKIIKPGMDSRQVVARFEAERQALALMDHPNIATVFDGGTTASGRPYFVMELVKGTPITRYCDEHRLMPRQRLELLLPVCQAIQHAHTKGIIHRDIKPANILVAPYDGRPVPKVIDFGVAKATGQRLTERTLFTAFGAVVGTLEYMSPEQAELNNQDIDTRSDIYSLAVLLYELLTGTTPLGHERVTQVGFAETLRLIREEDPQRPSTRLSASKEKLPAIAAQRHMELAKLTKALRGELDWIVMKALEKDRNRRYETANSLGGDIERYLRDEPVLACPPSAAYRLRKLLRRHRGAVLVGVVMLLALVVLVLALAVSNVVILREKNQKVDALKEKDAALITARQHELTARRRFYAAQMNLAQQAWEASNPGRTIDLLEGQRPGPEEVDLRSFEWCYLWYLCHQGNRLSLKVPKTRAVGLLFSPDGKTLAARYHDATIRLWDAATGRQQAILKADEGEIQAWAFASDARALHIVMTQHGSINLKRWDLVTGREMTITAGYGGTVKSAALSPDGKTLATGAEDGTVALWDAATLHEKTTLSGHDQIVSGVTFSSDGRKLASSASFGPGKGHVLIWDLASRSARRLPTVRSHFMAFSPDSQLLALSGKGDGDLPQLFDVATGRLYRAFEGHTGGVYAVTFAPDGRTLATGSNDRNVRLFDVRTGKQRAIYADTGPIYALGYSPDGKTLASAGYDGTITLRHAEPFRDDLTLPGVGAMVAFSPDGKAFASAGPAALRLWDVATWKETAAIAFTNPNEPAESLAFAHAGKTLAVAHYQTLKLFDVAPIRERASVHGARVFWNVAFSPGDSMLTSASFHVPYVSLRDPTTLHERGRLVPDTQAWARVCAFSPDGALVATGSQFGILKLFDAATGQERAILQPSVGNSWDWIYCTAFSPDGNLLASGNQKGTITLWDISTREPRTVFKGHTDAVFVLAFTGDGGSLATGGADKTVKLWDVATGQERITLKGFKAEVRSLAFSPNGTLLAAGSWDGTVRIWRTAVDAEALARRTDDPAR